MPRSFICFDNKNMSSNDKGFWINDHLLQIVCWYIVETIDRQSQIKEIWLKKDLRDHFYNNAIGMFNGFMHLNFSEYLANNDQKKIFDNILIDTKKLVFQKGEAISINELNQIERNKDIELRSEWQSPFETARIIKIIDALEQLIAGKLTLTFESDSRTYEW